jgi:hypothetical protein
LDPEAQGDIGAMIGAGLDSDLAAIVINHRRGAARAGSTRAQRLQPALLTGGMWWGRNVKRVSYGSFFLIVNQY